MPKVLNQITLHKKYLIFVICIFSTAIIFETLQQYYYIKRFNLAENIVFTQLLKRQSLKWLVWLVLCIPLISYCKKTALKYKSATILSYIVFVLALVVACVFIIAIGQQLTSNEPFSLSLFFKEYVTFYTFQKAPIYTLGYISVAIIFHFYFINSALQIKVESLLNIKASNTELYNQLRQQNDDKTSVLNIKIGNKRKIIPIHDIYWIEADDYCVIVHTNNDKNYTMRSSLKTLENKLEKHFLRVHRKAIVNMKMVKEINWSSTPELVLKNNERVAISKSKLKVVKNFTV